MVQWGTKTVQYWDDREEAGQELADRLLKYANGDVVVLGLPRGGVVTAAQVARELEAPLGVVIARKISHPSSPEFAIAAVTEKGEPIINFTKEDGVDAKWFDAEVAKQRKKAAWRRQAYTSGKKQPRLAGKTVILIDDGMATGLTMRAAIAEVRAQKPAKVIVAVPVAPEDAASEIKSEADKFVCLHIEATFFSSVSNYYTRFEQVDDDEVIDVLQDSEDVV